MSDRPHILCTDPECRFLDGDLTRLGEAATIEISPDYAIPRLAPKIERADVLVTSCFAKVPAELIAAGPRLRGIVKYGVGVDNIDLDCAARRGVPVANCPDYGSGTVADHAFALLLALARRLSRQDQVLRRQGWFWPDERFCGVDLEGKTLGLIGLGRIGRKMAKRGAGFDMRLVTTDPYVDPASVADEPFQIDFVSLDSLLAQSDFVSIHCVLTAETRHLLGRRELRTMKSTAYLIDVSRGAIIEQQALIEALGQGWIAGAGLDVFDTEPLPADHALRKLENVVITPHLAWYTREAAAEQSRQAADAVLDILARRQPRSVVNGVQVKAT